MIMVRIEFIPESPDRPVEFTKGDEMTLVRRGAIGKIQYKCRCFFWKLEYWWKTR